ncbi:hypothetical protein HWV00_21145 (plasmid) [Moritella sp. 24]|uniref:phage baseplate assembly protein V n=1 Tax=Moritella sp. 24 TaxID=2746230 RepID=UPI001BAC32FE|nr:phage baseplate assembly protein V [Moritella sp. 24]QUM78782.1 hypothetical protein HWV00_21145 [Moritella sp. 24]
MSDDRNNGALRDKYRAKVVSITHPKGWHKAKVRVLVLWDHIEDDDLPWAEYLLPLGARSKEGEAMPCKIDDLVWLEFPISGDTRSPLIVGSCYRIIEGESELPQDLFKPVYEHKRTGKQPPAPTAAYGDSTTDLNGILNQITMNGAWCLTHKATGTAVNVTKDGQLVLHTEGDSFSSTTGTHTEEVTKDLISNVGGKLNVHVIGDALIKADANLTVEAGADMLLKSGGKCTVDAGGPLMLKGSMISGKSGGGYDFK